jgi:hypothetical protein
MSGYSGKPLVQKLGIKPGFGIFAGGGARQPAIATWLASCLRK